MEQQPSTNTLSGSAGPDFCETLRNPQLQPQSTGMQVSSAGTTTSLQFGSPTSVLPATNRGVSEVIAVPVHTAHVFTPDPLASVTGHAALQMTAVPANTIAVFTSNPFHLVTELVVPQITPVPVSTAPVFVLNSFPSFTDYAVPQFTAVSVSPAPIFAPDPFPSAIDLAVPQVTAAPNSVVPGESTAVYQQPGRAATATTGLSTQVVVRRECTASVGIRRWRNTIYGDRLDNYAPPHRLRNPPIASTSRATDGVMLPNTVDPSRHLQNEDPLPPVVHRRRQQNPTGNRVSSRPYSFHGDYRTTMWETWTESSIQETPVCDGAQQKHAEAERRNSFNGSSQR